MRKRIVIAGASGFIGRNLIFEFSDCDIVALYRSFKPSQRDSHVEWRQCDLFSLKQTMRALQGVDTAIYLVHSMLPNARLFQGNFQDTDLIIADNFARACLNAGVQRILYLGGLEQDHISSEHLKSRFEVENVFRSTGIPVTTLRAGIVIGENGSSFQILESLVKRLPILLGPKWTQNRTEAVAISDVRRAFRFCVENEDTQNNVYDLGSGEEMTYERLIKLVAHQLKLKRKFVRLPYVTPKLSVLWIHLITGADFQLISPLVQSLKTSLRVSEKNRLPTLKEHSTPIRVALEKAVLRTNQKLTRGRMLKSFQSVQRDSQVRSVQRLPLPSGKNIEWVALEYMRWLPRFFRSIIRVNVFEEESLEFTLFRSNIVLLELKLRLDYSPQGRRLYEITGGKLALIPKEPKHPLTMPRLEFREVPSAHCILAAIHDFKPRLPWFIYKFSQALLHLWVMKCFARHLENTDTDKKTESPTHDSVAVNI